MSITACSRGDDTGPGIAHHFGGDFRDECDRDATVKVRTCGAGLRGSDTASEEIRSSGPCACAENVTALPLLNDFVRIFLRGARAHNFRCSGMNPSRAAASRTLFRSEASKVNTPCAIAEQAVGR